MHDPKGALPHYYFHMTLGTAQWEHPCLTHWRSVLHELVGVERQKLTHDPTDPGHAFLGADPRVAQRVAEHVRGPHATLWVGARDDASDE